MARPLPRGYGNSWSDEKGFEVSGHEYDELDNDLFHIGQGYDRKACVQLICRRCKGDKFYIGNSSYYTAIKCLNCGFETMVHSG